MLLQLLKYLLNAPYTLLGLINLLLCIPYKVRVAQDALVFNCITCGLLHIAFPTVRGFASGNIAIVRNDQPVQVIDHELVHIEQYMRYPFIFGFMYMYELRKGYWNNKFEIEAYSRTDTWPPNRRP